MASTKRTVEDDGTGKPLPGDMPACGIVMPIADFAGYPASHWSSVESILCESLSSAGFKAKLVSQETSSGVIHQRIIGNLYSSELVVCDVSARNPNVMFELGVRLTFDKPTIIVKDDETPFSFDTGIIDHIPYPRSLNYHGINEFKERLANTAKDTMDEAAKDPQYSTFLRHFSGIKAPKLQLREGSAEEYIVERLDLLSSQISSIRDATRNSSSETSGRTELVVRLQGSAREYGKALMQGIDENTEMIAYYEPGITEDILNVKPFEQSTVSATRVREEAEKLGIPVNSMRITRRVSHR